MIAEKFSKVIPQIIKLFLPCTGMLLLLYAPLGAQTENSGKSSLFSPPIRFYQNYIGPVRISHCQMHPSCSEYGIQAFENQSPIVALLSTSDRLLRCSHDHKIYSKTYAQGKKLLFDPLVQGLIPEAHHPSILFDSRDTLPEIKFINHLIAKKRYHEALLEMNRMMYFQDSVQTKNFYANYLACLRALDEMEEGIYAWEHDFPTEMKNKPEVIRELGNLYLDLQQYDRAIDRYIQSKNLSKDSLLIDRSNLLLGLGYASTTDWENSRKSFAEISHRSLYSSYSRNCLNVLQLHEGFRYKKPALAGTLAIIPGLGYLYAGHPQTALSSLLINGVLFYAGYSSYKNENYALTALLGIFSLSFYIGNISGSVKSAKRYNTSGDRKVIHQLKSNIPY